jgi:transcriptional regulator with XRE-family HTH domain
MAHSELGDQLRHARESKDLSPEELEKKTGIRKRFLQAMEEGRFDVLPGPVQVRGFLKSYASCVGLNPDEILACYERETRSVQTAAALKSASPARPVAVRPTPPQPKPQPVMRAAAPPPTQSVAPPSHAAAPPQPAAITQPVTQVPPASTQPQLAPAPVKSAPAGAPSKSASPASIAASALFSQRPAWLTVETGLIALAAILVICVLVLAAFLFLGPGLSQPAFAPRPTPTRTLRATLPPPPTVPPATPTVAAAPIITAGLRTTGTGGYVQLALAATEHVWVRVSTDGTTAFEGMFAPGQALNWEAKELVIVEAGNGAGLTASYNGKPVGVLGPRGQIVARAWTPTGEIILPPTPTPSIPTPSPTP